MRTLRSKKAREEPYCIGKKKRERERKEKMKD
jgi:hypothetical protein